MLWKDIGLIRLCRIIHQCSAFWGLLLEEMWAYILVGTMISRAKRLWAMLFIQSLFLFSNMILFNSFLVTSFLLGLSLGHSNSWLSALLTLYRFGMGTAEISVLDIKGCNTTWRRYVMTTEWRGKPTFEVVGQMAWAALSTSTVRRVSPASIDTIRPSWVNAWVTCVWVNGEVISIYGKMTVATWNGDDPHLCPPPLYEHPTVVRLPTPGVEALLMDAKW